MSGEYKYSYYTINPGYSVTVNPGLGSIVDPTTALVVLGSIAAERAAHAVIEEGRRLDREESVLASGLKSSKDRSFSEIDKLSSLLHSSSSSLMQVDAATIRTRLDDLRATVASARTHGDLARHAADTAALELAVHRAVQRKALADARGRGQATEERRTRFTQLRDRFAGMSGPDGGGDGPLDPAGAQAVRKLVAEAAASMQGHDAARQDKRLDALDAAVGALEERAGAARVEAARKKAVAEAAEAQLGALVEGLTADEIVMRWLPAEAEALRTSTPPTTEDELAARIENARRSAAEIVHTANVAQIKADQRDYVARSIRSVFEQMGYVVDGPVAEYPEHPATAMIVRGSSPSGRAISVSVPFEGQVWYNVDGFVKTTEAAVGGGTAAVCDEAEAVISQMHEALAEEYHVDMGEIMWEGKDPNRNLRQARALPDGESRDRSF